MIKKLFALSLILGSMVFAIPTAEAKTLSENSVETNNIQKGWQQNNRRKNRWKKNRIYIQRSTRVVTRTRFVYINGRRYREIWQYKYLPNGRVETRLLGRTRIR